MTSKTSHCKKKLAATC